MSSFERSWAQGGVSARLSILKAFRHALAHERDSVLELLAPLRPHSSRGELLSSELIPLLDACSYLEKNAAKILAPQSLGRTGQPAWLWGVESVIHREAIGRVLILSPSNYPLFLPMVQALQAWAGGNSVWLKSAPGSLALHKRLQEMFVGVGGHEHVFKLLGEDNSVYGSSLSDVQKVVLVGSAQTGRKVLAQAASALVPSIAELSGWDTVFVHPEADLEKTAQALAFALSLNQGRTCVAPRRVFFRGEQREFEGYFETAIRGRTHSPLSPEQLETVADLQACGARILCREPGFGPLLATDVPKSHKLLAHEQFGPIAVLIPVTSDEEALEVAHQSPYALGASCFGPEDWAQEIAHRVPAQMVSINDCVVPTADPRIPFGGSGQSGYGRMRGAEGLLEMTQTRTVSSRRGGSLDHLLPPGPLDELIVEKFLLMSHSATSTQKAKALAQMILAIARERIRKRRAKRARHRHL